MDASGRALLWAAGRPGVERLVRRSRLSRGVVDRFVAGDDLDAAARAARALNARGIGAILDLLGEGVTDGAQADAAVEAYRASLERLAADGADATISVKPSQLGLAFDTEGCRERFRDLDKQATAAGMRLEIDMEDSATVDATLALYRALADDDPPRLAVQAYLRRTPADVAALAPLGAHVRLVKGAYAEPAGVALQGRAEVDAQYRRLTDLLFAQDTDPAIATHDLALVDHAKAAARLAGRDRDGFEFQMLYGIRQDLQRRLRAEGHRVRVYVPYGTAWYAYLTRRLAERPSNLRFFLRVLAGH